MGKKRGTITHALTDLSRFFSSITKEDVDETDKNNLAIKLKSAHIVVTYPSSDPTKSVSIVEYQINQQFPISHTNNFSSDFSVETTNKITVIVTHDNDGNVLFYSTAYPSPGTEILKLDQHQNGRPLSLPSPPPLPTEEHPSQQTPRPLQEQNPKQIQSQLEEKIAQLSPEEQALWAEMTEEPQSKKGKQKKQGRK